jgi:hypothetical protein
MCCVVLCKTVLFNVPFEQHKSDKNHRKIQVTFPHNLLNFQHNFPLDRETLYTGRVKLFIEASKFFTDSLVGSSVINTILKSIKLNQCMKFHIYLKN